MGVEDRIGEYVEMLLGREPGLAAPALDTSPERVGA